MYYDEDRKMFLNVNRGIGAIGFPGRVGIRPEITLVEMV
jgi:predicted MPP superfamily phosphohydrolase